MSFFGKGINKDKILTAGVMQGVVSYSASEEMKIESEQEVEIDGVDPWKAAMQGDLDALLQYIDDGGDVNQRDRDNNTPLHWACQESHFDIVGVLMSRNAAVDPVNDLQSTPLHYACREGNLDIVTGLINFSANLEARNKDNLSPLHVAAGMGHIEVTKRLLDNLADMEAEDNALYTPLWRAAYYGHPEVVKVLLDKGANRLARNKKGRKPGDVFSPQVDKDKQDKIKAMLGMNAEPARVPPPPSADGLHPGARVSEPHAKSDTLVGGGAGVEGGEVESEVAPSTRSHVDMAPSPATPAVGMSNDDQGVSETPTVPASAYKSSRRDPPEATPTQPDSSYVYPDPSPANSPLSVMQSNTTALSEATVASAVRQASRMGSSGSIDSAAASALNDHNQHQHQHQHHNLVSGGGALTGGGGSQTARGALYRVRRHLALPMGSLQRSSTSRNSLAERRRNWKSLGTTWRI
ncbi:unnamed protein product [Discosporangium mesarthrocarpum]